MKRLVLDTNVVASAMLWSGIPHRFLQAARERRIALFTSTTLLTELTDILGRRKFEKKISTSTLTIDQIIDRYAALAAVVRPVSVPRIAADPDDDVVIGTALAAQADLIVSGDADLLTIQSYEGIRIVKASTAIELIEQP